MIEQKMPNKNNYRAKLRYLSQRNYDKLRAKALKNMRIGLKETLEEAANRGCYSVTIYTDDKRWYDKRYISFTDIQDYCINELKLNYEFVGLMINAIKISWGE